MWYSLIITIYWYIIHPRIWKGVPMTITSLSPASTNPTIGNSAIDTAILAKNLDTFEEAGREMVKMMELSVNPNLGANIDMSV
jgi:hypothetical protein